MADFDMANHRSSGRKKSSRGRSGGGDRFKRRDSRRSRGRAERPEMHEVICDGCGNKCQVPFKPTSSKPVYCSECFEKKNSSKRGSSQSSEEFAKINQKLDKILETLKISE